MQTEKVITVREAILLCIKYGIKGAESQLLSFDKNGRLSTKNQIKALQGNLECIYHSVTIIGSGKRGRVVLVNKKSNVAQKSDRRSNNTGQPVSDEQLLMTSYIHRLLYTMHKNKEHMEYGLNGWSKRLKLIDVDDLPDESFKEIIISRYRNTPSVGFNPVQITREFKKALYAMNTSVVSKSFNRLENEGKLEFSSVYNLVNAKGKKKNIEFEEYKDISARRMELLKELGSSISEFNNSLSNSKPSKRMKRILDHISTTLIEEFDCKFIYESFKITNVKNDYTYIEENQFTDAYWNDFIRRTERRQRLYDSKMKGEQTWLWRKLWAFNTFTILDYLGVDTGGLLAQYETENIGRIIELLDAQQMLELKDENASPSCIEIVNGESDVASL